MYYCFHIDLKHFYDSAYLQIPQATVTNAGLLAGDILPSSNTDQYHCDCVTCCPDVTCAFVVVGDDAFVHFLSVMLVVVIVALVLVCCCYNY